MRRVTPSARSCFPCSPRSFRRPCEESLGEPYRSSAREVSARSRASSPALPSGRKRQRTNEDYAREAKKLKESARRLAEPIPRRRIAPTSAALPPRNLKSLHSRLFKSLSSRRADPPAGNESGAASAEVTFQFNEVDLNRSVSPGSKSFVPSSLAPFGPLSAAPGIYGFSRAAEGMPSFKAMVGLMQPPGLFIKSNTDNTKHTPEAPAAPLAHGDDVKVPGQFDPGVVSIMKYAKAEARIGELARELAQEKANVKDMRRAYDGLAQREWRSVLCASYFVPGIEAE